MSTTIVAPDSIVDERATVIVGHPRGRGFGILSRLARTDDSNGRHVRSDAVPEEHATVLTFERRTPSPRHRRDDLALLNFG